MKANMMKKNEIPASLTTMNTSGSTETGSSMKISVIFIVAIAVRKFQEIESNRFKKSLTFDFDRRLALEKLRRLCAAVGSLKKKEHFIKLSYYVRKFNLTFGNIAFIGVQLNELCNLLKDDLLDDQTMYFLCLSLKHLCRNSDESTNPLNICSIAQRIATVGNRPLVKNELVTLLLCRLEKLPSEWLDSDESSKLRSMIANNTELNHDVKTQIFDGLAGSKAPGRFDKQEKERMNKSVAVRKVKKNQQIVSKTIQTVKSQQESKSSEAVDFEFLNLSDCMKNRNKGRNCRAAIEPPDTSHTRSGSDQSFWRSTWGEVMHLYSKALQDRVLRAEDKDDYLPKRFLGTHYIHLTYGDEKRMYSFFVNRTLASIYAIISQRQQINDRGINVLMSCVVDFDRLLSFLDLDRNYVNMMLRTMYREYFTLKDMRHIDTVYDFFRKVSNLTMEEYETGWWIFSRTQVKMKSYIDTFELRKIIKEEINAVRLDAIKALYNCARRDLKEVLTKKRMAIFTRFAQSNDQSDSKTMDYIFKIMELAETLDDFDYAEAFDMYLGYLKPDSVNDFIDKSIRFLTNQARDRKRCQQLFTNIAVAKLIELVGPTSRHSEGRKLGFLEMINISLEHEETKAMSESNLQQLMIYCWKSDKPSVINACLTSLLMSTDKSRHLSSEILKQLSTAFSDMSHNEEITSYIVFILSRIFCLDDAAFQNLHISDPSLVDSVSSKLFCDHIVRLNSEDDEPRVSFHKQSKKNASYNPSNRISSLSAKIITRSVEHKVSLSSTTIDNLLLILQHNGQGDKQTVIVAAKCLYDSTKYMSLGSGSLNQLLDSINCPIYDVSVYIQAAYLRECVKVASSTECLKDIHLENISALYLEDSLELNEYDYQAEINSNLFETLLYEAKKQQFNDENLFLLFDNILNLNGIYAPQVLSVLVAYSQKFLMPETTVRTLENLLNVASYFEEALLALQSFVLNGGLSITIKTLTVFSDYLCSSTSKHVRLNWFKLLDRLSQSQELPDSIFFKLELVRASYALDYDITVRESVLQYVESITEKGAHLPMDTKNELEKLIAHPDVLKTFQNVSKRKQIIDEHLLESFIKLFDPSNKAYKKTIANNRILIRIFENAAKNNQSLPKHLLRKLEVAFDVSDLEPDVLPLFIYLAQKGEYLSRDVNHKLLNILAGEVDSVLKQELLSSLGSLIFAQKAEIELYLPKINQILKKEITSDNFNIQKSCVSTIAKLVMVYNRLDDKLLEKLVKIGTDLNSNKIIKREIQTLFDFIKDSDNPLIEERGYRKQINLANLVGTTHQDVFYQIVRYRNTELLVQNYNQLKEIIDSGDRTLQEEALNMLINYRFKSEITDELLDSIVILFESTLVDTLSNSCLNLLKLIAESGKTLTGRAWQIWNDKLNRMSNLQKFLQGSVCKEIKKEFKLDNQTILNLMELIQETSKIDGISNLSDLMELIASEASNDYFNNMSFVRLVEGCLAKRRSVDVVLPYYCRIIKEQKYVNVQQCLEMLVECFAENPQEMAHFETQLFECMHNAHKYIHLSEGCMKFVVKHLGNSNQLISGYSFGILKTSKEQHKNKKYTNVLKGWCDFMIQSLAKNMNVEIEQTKDYVDVLEIIMSVKFLDASIFTKEPRDLWKQELLISSIFSSFKACPTDQIKFNTQWSTVVDKFKYYESCKILLLIHNSTLDSFTQILELTTMILELKTVDEVTQMLTIYGPEPYEVFKQNWCTRKIARKFQDSNKQGISAKYSNKLAEKLCSLFNFPLICKLMSCFKSIDNLSAFEDLIDFCSKERIEPSDMVNIENVSLNDVKCLIEANHLCKCSKIIQPEGEVDRKCFIQLYATLKTAGWKYEQLRQLLVTFNPKGTFGLFQNWLHFLNTIQAYTLPSLYFSKVQQILSNTTSFLEIIQKLNQLVIDNRFQLKGKVKDLHELITELKTTNEVYIDPDSLNIRKLISEEQKDKLIWSEKEIGAWSKSIRSGKTFTDNEAIAIILRANFLVTGHTLTETQILASLMALTPGGNPRGKLLQIATGEGKSTIICILAIIQALRGKRVDVITSSPVLAERDVKQKTKLYRMFNLTCSDNSDKTVYISGQKDCYKANVVYGEMSQFQFDILRDNYSKLGTLCGRKSEMAIVDEVDSMLIDDSSKIARLSSTVPGMDHFQALYIIIWQRLLAIKEKFIMFKDTIYFVYGKIGYENGKICLEMADHDDDIIKIPDLEDFLLNNNCSHVAEIVGDDIDDFLMRTLGSYLDSQIEQNKIFIPSNFQSFLHKQKPKWIVNAVEALNYQENVHYIVQGGEIKPVDYLSTGVVQSSTSWSNGLHQFLQLKHNLKITSETLTTNFLSNVGYMKKYENICGVTGTLGSKTARSVFKDVYRVGLINIPQRHEKQFLELEPIVAQGEAEWLKAITVNIMLEIDKSRGILVICETIECVNRIHAMLKNKISTSAVKLYTTNNSKQEESVEKISAGQVIIATNLAGRGTDIQTHEIEPTGGLHVILTFLPNNERVEAQAFGRTARQGKRGTGLMILNGSSLIGYSETSKDGLNQEREKAETRQLKEFQKNELKLIQVKDRLFDTFCTFLNNEIRLSIRKKFNSKATIHNFLYLRPSTIEVCTLAAAEEQWAGFLSKLDEEVIPCEKAETECRTLINQLRSDFQENNLIKNPCHHVSIANDILVNESHSQTSRALEHFNKAIRLEADWRKSKQDITDDKKRAGREDVESVFGSGSAYMGVAWCSILLREENYKTNALASFTTALHCLSNEMSVLNATQLLLEQRQIGFHNSDLYKQLNVKATILGSYLTGISNCIDAIKKSKRMIDLVAVKKHNERENTLETIEQFNDQERDEIEQKLSSEMSYSLIFNHLTVREDSGTIDQALRTLENAFNKNLVKEERFSSKHSCLDVDSYRNIRLNLKSIELSKLNSDLFNPDKVFKELSRESAIQTLKSERTFGNSLGLTKSYSTILTIHTRQNERNAYFLSIEEHSIRSTDERKLNETPKSDQMNELIDIIVKQKLNDENLRFDIVIKEANENDINKLFQTSGRHSSVKLNLDFNQLSQEMAMARLSAINAASYDVEFVLNKSELINFINDNDQLQGGMLFVENVQAFQRVNRAELLTRVSKLKMDESPCWVRFEMLTYTQAKKIVESCHENVQFGVSFVDINDFFSSTVDLDDGQVNFSFDNLSRDTAKWLINVLRDKKIEFTLEFKSLSDRQVRHISKHADLEQEEMEIRKVKNIRDLYSKATIVPELNDFISKGIEYIIEIAEKQFVPWWSVFAVLALGVGQIILGGVLIATGFGSTVGIGLITEGIADIYTAYSAYSNRQFQWSDYCKQKAISLALSMVCMGYSKLKEGVKSAVKGIQSVTTGINREALKQAGKQLIYNRKVVGQALIKTGKNLKKFSCKYIGTKAAEAVAKEGLNVGIQYLSNVSFDLMKPHICESIQSSVRMSFNNGELKLYLRKMLAIDQARGSSQLQSRIDQIVSDIINPRHDFMRQQWDSVALPLIKGILSSRYGSSASMVFRIGSLLTGLNDVLTLTDNICNALVTKLRAIDRDLLTIHLILHGHLKINKDRTKDIVSMLNKQNILDDKKNFGILYDDEIKHVKAKIDKFEDQWSRLKSQPMNREVILKEEFNNDINTLLIEGKDVANCTRFITCFFDKYSQIESEHDSFSIIIKSVSDQITDQLISIIDNQMLHPFTTMAVSNLVDSVSRRVQNSLIDRDQNSDSHKADQEKYEKLSQKSLKELTDDDKAFMSSYGRFRTFVEQINYNSRDYCDAYLQCEMVYHANQDDAKSKLVDKNVKEMANQVRKGAPANIGVMMETAKANGINLKVVDDPDYVKTQEDIDNNVDVIYAKPAPNGEIGHAYYMDSDGRLVETKQAEPTKADCFFTALSEIAKSKGVNKTVSELRNDAADRMESNSGNFAKVMTAENRIRQAHPDAENRMIFAVGVKWDENMKLVLENGDLERARNELKRKDFDGHPYGQESKALVPESLGVVNDPKEALQETDKNNLIELLSNVVRDRVASETCHHEVPKSFLKKRFIEAAEKPIKFEPVVNQFLNNELTKEAFIKAAKFDKPPEQQLPKEEHGKVIAALAIAPPNNYVRGPRDAKRADAVGNLLDEPIVKQQTLEHQTSIRKTYEYMKKKNGGIEGYAELAKTSPSRPVLFEKIRNPEPPKKPGGFVKEYRVVSTKQSSTQQSTTQQPSSRRPLTQIPSRQQPSTPSDSGPSRSPKAPRT